MAIDYVKRTASSSVPAELDRPRIDYVHPARRLAIPDATPDPTRSVQLIRGQAIPLQVAKTTV